MKFHVFSCFFFSFFSQEKKHEIDCRIITAHASLISHYIEVEGRLIEKPVDRSTVVSYRAAFTRLKKSLTEFRHQMRLRIDGEQMIPSKWVGIGCIL